MKYLISLLLILTFTGCTSAKQEAVDLVNKAQETIDDTKNALDEIEQAKAAVQEITR